MSKRQFKAESKKLLDLMVNSIYTNKEIFLRELISNANDALDKLSYESLTNKNIKVDKKKLEIDIAIDKGKRLLTISDNGIGMDKDELADNLGTIAKSGTLAFKEALEKKDKVNVIGQFGVGFYSSFMVADKVVVESKKAGNNEAYQWVSTGADGYEITSCDKKTNGTTITLHIKESDKEEKYDEYLEEFKVQSLIKKYSDYVTYPIKMEKEDEETKEKIMSDPINSMVPIWKKNKKKIKDEEYYNFYQEKFFDYSKPLKVIHTKAEGLVSYDALMFIPAMPPYDFYTKEYKKGLELYSNGVLIMEKCEDLLPDYLNFVKGVVDSPDLSLNISREMLQQNRQLKVIAKNIEKKILKELTDMLENERETYEAFFKTFGVNIKYGVYDNYGEKKDELKDLVIFYSSKEKKMVTLKEYVSRMNKDDDTIYYACGETIDKIDMMPQVENLKDKKKEVLYLTDYVDEFVLKMLDKYEDKKFINIASNDFDLSSEEEKEELKKKNEDDKEMFEFMKNELGDEVSLIRYTNKLKNHPICLTSEGNVTVEMQKVINAMPTDEHIDAKLVLEINEDHEIAKKIKDLYESDKETLKKYTKILYDEARLIEGLPVENPTELSNLVCEMLSK
ncbi:MAG: molecular chaperone HtpG [Candidatus Aphodocola sp.]